MYIVKYTLTPRNVWVGYIKKDGKFHFCAGKNLQQLIFRAKSNMKNLYGTPFTQVALDARPMNQDDFPSDLIDNKWFSVWWSGIRKDGQPAAEMGWKIPSKKKSIKKVKDEEPVVKPEPVNPSYDFHITREVDGKIKVYGCVLINEYSAE